MTYYITKFALTNQGIVEYTPVIKAHIELGHLLYEGYAIPPRHWHKDKESALAQAERMRKAKIAQLKSQISKYQKINFK